MRAASQAGVVAQAGLPAGHAHPFLPGHTAQGIGLLVASAGFAGASVALLRMRNDEFDLTPLEPADAAAYAA